MKRILLTLLALVIGIFLLVSISYAQQRNLRVAVIAPSISTSIKAREIRKSNNWLEVNPREADYILVVVRSNLFNPLNYSYDNYDSLEKDAEYLPNITGSNYHIYLYELKDDLSVSQVKHTYFEAED